MSKIFRQVQSKAFNPTYSFDTKTEGVSLGEVAGPILVFGDLKTGTVSRAMVEYWFGMLVRTGVFQTNRLT